MTTKEQYSDPRVLKLIDVAPPSRDDVYSELESIAEEFKVEYTRPADETKEEEKPGRIVIESVPDPVKYEQAQAVKKEAPEPPVEPEPSFDTLPSVPNGLFLMILTVFHP